MGTHIILIGFMGAGKTTVGKALAKALDRPLFDTDKLIEEQAAMSISRIFEVYGEERFRSLETETIRNMVSAQGSWVLSVGGGLPLRKENRKLLKQAGCVIYLRVQPGTVLNRLRGDTTRPLLSGGDVKERVEKLLSDRSPVYEEAAHITVDVDGKRPEEIAEEILRKSTGSSIQDKSRDSL